jgi:hypothetical protein
LDLIKRMARSNQTNVEPKLIDDCFYVQEKPYGLWHSWDKDGKGLITALTEDSCISGTRFYLKGIQEGWPDNNTATYDGTVGGKL